MPWKLHTNHTFADGTNVKLYGGQLGPYLVVKEVHRAPIRQTSKNYLNKTQYYIHPDLVPVLMASKSGSWNARTSQNARYKGMKVSTRRTLLSYSALCAGSFRCLYALRRELAKIPAGTLDTEQELLKA